MRMHGVRIAEPSRKVAEGAEASASGESNGAALNADGAATGPQDEAAERAASRPGPSDQEEEPLLVPKATVILDDAAAHTKEYVPSESQPQSLLTNITSNQSNMTAFQRAEKVLHDSCTQMRPQHDTA